MTVLDVKPFTPEEKLYEQKLGQLAASALGQDWRVCWPEHLQKTRPLGWLSEHGEYGCIKAMILRAEERYTGKDAVCFIENITLPWTIILGAAWGLDPSFFISHVRPLTDGEAEQTLKHSRVPNSRGGLRPFRGQSWVTMRGYVDLGKRKNLTPSDLRDTTRRRHRESVFETRQSHTNMSFYKVSDCLCMR